MAIKKNLIFNMINIKVIIKREEFSTIMYQNMIWQ